MSQYTKHRKYENKIYLQKTKVTNQRNKMKLYETLYKKNPHP